ncbi:MAG: GGDEF domain-containing protein [Allosphingosinicella sp.]
MTIKPDFAIAIPDEQLSAEVRAAIARLLDENALLRASLAELRERVGELEDSTDLDELTALPNHKQFLAQLERFVSSCSRHGTAAALLTIDLCGLRQINERHGQVAGDAALTHVARLLKGLIRTSDVAARTEGAAFSLLLDHLDGDSAIDTGERIARYIAGNPLDLGNAQVALGATVSVATILPGDSVDDVLLRAERNLERVKEF